MNFINRFFLFCLLFFSTTSFTYTLKTPATCADALANAHKTYDAAKKGISADEIEYLHKYAQRTMDAALATKQAATECHCHAKWTVEDATKAYEYAQKALQQDTFRVARKLLKKAKFYADNSIADAEDC